MIAQSSEAPGTQADARFAKSLRERVEEVVRRYGQASVARKTGTSATNVSRYVRGTRIPAEFCAALVANLGINPIWLLTGDGGMQLTDLTAGTAKTTTDLLELVEAMNTAMRVSMGALAGTNQQMVLRKLNDSLVAHRRIQRELNEKTKPLLRKLLADHFRLRTVEFDTEGAGRLLRAAEQTLTICDDLELNMRYKGLAAAFAVDTGAQVDAIKMFAEVFRHQFTLGKDIDDFTLANTVNYAAMLRSVNRFGEALAVCRAMRELCRDRGPFKAQYFLAFIEGACEAELGRLPEGLTRMIASVPMMEPMHQRTQRATIQGAYLLSGAIPLAEVLAADHAAVATWLGRTRELYSNSIASYIVLLGEARDIERAAAIFNPGEERFSGAGWPFATTFLLALGELAARARRGADVQPKREARSGAGRGQDWRAVLEDSEYLAWRGASDALKNFVAATYACRLHWEGGDLAAARREHEAARLARGILPEAAPARLVDQALYFVNALAIGRAGGLDEALLAEARAFFDTQLAGGYAALKAVAERYSARHE